MLDRRIYAFFDATTTAQVLWIALFLTITIAKLIARARGREVPAASGISGELSGLPLTLLHSACFGYALWLGDWVSAALFAWWGPGFLWVASWFLYIKAKRIDFDWEPFALTTSILCKLNYAALMVVFLWHGLHGIPFVFSLWIMHDQVRLAWLHGNADRTRRSTEDLWLVRLAYAGFLFLPWFVSDFPLRTLTRILGPLVGVLWIVGIWRVVVSGRFRRTPDNADENLRNIVYLRSRRDASG